MKDKTNSSHHQSPISRRKSLIDVLKARVVMMGAAGVGKTSLIDRFLFTRFSSGYKETVEQLYHEDIDIDGHVVSLDILDTAGEYQFPAMRKLAITSADAFILVFAVNDAESFNTVTRLREEILSLHPRKRVPIVVVGNKCDLVEERAVAREELLDSLVSIDWEQHYTEVSAKDDFNVLEVFEYLLKVLSDTRHPGNVTQEAASFRRHTIHFPDRTARRRSSLNEYVEKRNSCAIS